MSYLFFGLVFLGALLRVYYKDQSKEVTYRALPYVYPTAPVGEAV